ncbi:Hypothetical predicted protein [Paramuricea clavata]|uniref:Uncharacterized protein n=1 Tax=Paramuricea clavata TaxID=317549 RepID=A0A6S7KE87_PARCT|nr:Hypothetical predicted protein [Paramuricea clavata]
MAMDLVALKLNLDLKDSPTNLHFQSTGFDEGYLDCSPVDGGTEPIEEVQISPRSVYVELDRNRQDETANDGAYQKLLKRHLTGYEIPARTEVESSYEEVYHSYQKEPS